MAGVSLTQTMGNGPTLMTDISRYKLSVHQVYDTIQAASDWLERDQQDVEQVSALGWVRQGAEGSLPVSPASYTRCEDAVRHV